MPDTTPPRPKTADPAPRPTYRSVKADILRRITGGDWGPGALLPGEIELAQAYGCARATVSRAMRDLAEDGIVERRRKAGTRVRAAPARQARLEIPLVRNEIEDSGAVYRHALVTRAEMPAPDWLRARLGLTSRGSGRGPAQQPLLHLECMHYADGVPYQHEDRWINLAALPQAREADFATIGPNEWLVRTVPYSEVEIGFFASAADAGLARHLGCTAGDPLFSIERTTWWQGQAITFVRLRYQPGHRMTTRY